jgi:hypothetical protein
MLGDQVFDKLTDARTFVAEDETRVSCYDEVVDGRSC